MNALAERDDAVGLGLILKPLDAGLPLCEADRFAIGQAAGDDAVVDPVALRVLGRVDDRSAGEREASGQGKGRKGRSKMPL